MTYKKKKKWIISITSFGMLGIVSTSVAISLSSCASLSNQETFTFSSSTNFIESSNSPLNPTFSNAPLDNYALSTQIGLVTYETTGQFKFNDAGERVESTQQKLKLEAATKIQAYKTVSTINDDGETVEQDELVGTLDQVNEDLTTNSNYNKIVSEATKFVFTINTNLVWVDSNGIVQQQLSGKDFERGLETYVLASKIGYQRNGYFITQIGLDSDKTIGYANAPAIDDPKYDIDNFRSTDDTFTLYLNQPYPYILSILTKTYFSPVPYTNEYVRNIRATSENYPLAITNGDIDQTSTDFTKLYGSGPVNVFLQHSWFAGPYYFSRFSNSQIVGVLNQKYLDATKEHWDPSNGRKIKRYVLNYGSGNPEIFYNRFIANQESWISVVPESRKNEAIINNTSKIYQTGVSQISQSNYIVYTPRPYSNDVDSGKLIPNNNVSDGAAQLIFNSYSKENLIFKSALSGLINHYELSKLNLKASGDFQLSSIPYGVFRFGNEITTSLENNSEYYEAISKDLLQGGLPRTYSVYKSGDKDGNFLFTGNNASFTVPYYSYDTTSKTYKKEDLQINKSTFVETLKTLGASTSNPLVFQYKIGDGSISTEYQSYLNSLERAIEALGEGYLDFRLNLRGGTNPSANEWFNSQSSSMGFSFWSPDYNGVGTWLEANNLLNANSSTGGNSYSSFPNIFKMMIISLKDLNATYDSSKNQFTAATTNDDNATSIFANDPWVSNKIWTNSKEYSQKGLEFANYMLSNNIFDGNAINSLLSSDEELQSLDKQIKDNANAIPSTPTDLLYLQKYFKLKSSDNTNATIPSVDANTNADTYATYLGIFAGISDKNSLWLTQTSDRAFNFLPRSENGLNEVVLNMVNPNFKVRVSGVSALNIRDFEYAVPE